MLPELSRSELLLGETFRFGARLCQEKLTSKVDGIEVTAEAKLRAALTRVIP